jgi:hypothetical protein
VPAIKFNVEKQQHSNWCWAAIAVSVDRYFNKNSTWCQCRVATEMAKKKRLKVKNCGTCRKPKPCPEKCNRPWSLDQALRLMGRQVGKFKDRALSFAEIERTIKAGRPVCLRILWGKGPDAHFVVISGCERSRSGHRWVDVEDPFSGSATWLYDEFRSNYEYSKGRWAETYPV